MSYRIECLIECQNYLGEGPIWDGDSGYLYWVDGTGRRKGKDNVFRYSVGSEKLESRQISDHDVGAISLRSQGGIVAALDDGFYFYDFDTGKLELISRVEEDLPRTRLNDGKTDRRGRFFAGGMDDLEDMGVCGLWRLDSDLSISKVADGLICTNGPCWSPDDRTFYVTDSFQREFWAYDYDIETGELSNRRTIATLEGERSIADGSTVDSEGFMWTTELITGELVRRDPEGRIERRIGMPVRNITSVTFGGENLDEIFVTSMARIDHPGAGSHSYFIVESEPQFGAGSVFRITGLGIQGLPEPKFAG